MSGKKLSWLPLLQRMCSDTRRTSFVNVPTAGVPSYDFSRSTCCRSLWSVSRAPLDATRSTNSSPPLHNHHHRCAALHTTALVNDDKAPVAAATTTSSATTVNKHLQLTAEQERSDTVSEGTVTCIWQESPTVKCFQIRVTDPQFSFKAGQWVDAFIPGLETVGGFSLASAPHQYQQTGSIVLAIKKALWAPAYWFYTQCKVGSRVNVRVGGDFYLDEETTSTRPPCPLLLVGGGVGVNPLAAIFIHAAHRNHLSAVGRRPVMLLYGARSEQELLFKDQLDSLCDNNNVQKEEHELNEEQLEQQQENSEQRRRSYLSVRYFTSRQQSGSVDSNIDFGHITKDVLAAALSDLCQNYRDTSVEGNGGEGSVIQDGSELSHIQDSSASSQEDYNIQKVNVDINNRMKSLDVRNPIDAINNSSGETNERKMSKFSKIQGNGNIQNGASTVDSQEIINKLEAVGLEDHDTRNVMNDTSDTKKIIDLGSRESSETVRLATSSDVEDGIVADAAKNVKDRVQVYLCGPPAMITSIEQQLLELGLTERQIKYEKWW